MKNIIGAGVWFTLILSGCQGSSKHTEVAASPAPPTLSLSPVAFEHNFAIAGKVAYPLKHGAQNYWLLSSEQQGLLLTDASGQTLSRYPGNFELIDRRSDIALNNKKVDVIATVDKESGRVLVLQLDWTGQQFSLLTEMAVGSAVEALCWSRMPQGLLSLFIADERGQISQSIIIDEQRQTLFDVNLRQFTGVPETKGCVSDEQTGALYVVEKNIGVWRYSSAAEAELQRELVAVSGQFGPLQGEISAINLLANGELLVATPEQHSLWLLDPTQPHNARQIELPDNLVIETAYGLYQPTTQTLLLGLYDDESAGYFQASVNIDLKPGVQAAAEFAQLLPRAETTPVPSAGDAADDPAVWINQQIPAHSRILATNKKQGLMVHDLQGQVLQQLDVGRVNNVDLRYGFTFNGDTIDIAAASNRTNQSISLFGIAPHSGEVKWLADIATDLGDPYGLCMYQAADRYYVFINDTDGRFQQYLLISEGTSLRGELVREFTVASQPEGCVADDIAGQLYFGEEAAGIWQVSATPTDSLPKLIAPLNQHFVADVEGLGIYTLDGQRFLLASSQGNNSYAVFAIDQDNRHLGSFQIGMNLANRVDGVSETDGLEVVSLPLGADYPKGLLVVQDGHNVMPTELQNFKLVNAEQIVALIEAWLQ